MLKRVGEGRGFLLSNMLEKHYLLYSPFGNLKAILKALRSPAVKRDV